MSAIWSLSGAKRTSASGCRTNVILSLGGGVCATLLLAALFASQFFGLNHVYGAGLLLFVATLLLGIALFRFAQEAWLGRREWEE